MQTGKTLSVLNIDSQLFGEGITIYEDKIYQITWRSRKGFIYDLKTFTLESTSIIIPKVGGLLRPETT